MNISAYQRHEAGTGQNLSFIILETTVDVETLTGILSRDIVLCNRINSDEVKIKVAYNVNKVIIPIESASHPESDYGFGNVLFDIAMKETGV